MLDSKNPKTFVSKKATMMLKPNGSYSKPNKHGEEILVPGEFTDEWNQVMNTKNKHEATVAIQSICTSTSNDLTNSPDLGLTSMYMKPNAETYNIPPCEKLKNFKFSRQQSEPTRGEISV